MISKELKNKKKEYYKLYDRFVKADEWFRFINFLRLLSREKRVFFQ